ncbi:MAG: glycosyltransferase family 9 protein [Micromonosporaceae bacterium]|nr:glycosyltransferase family 9 protein [Micromonosporaceae bacterium]
MDLHGARRVAVLRPGRIGDYLCATPAVRALRAMLPHARLDYIGLPLVRDLVERNPQVDRFVAFPGFPYLAEQFFEPRAATRWLVAMQRERYDLAVQLYGSGVYANPVGLLLGAAYTAGFVRPEDGAHLLDAALPLPERGAEVDRALALVRHVGRVAGLGATSPGAGRRYDLALTGADRAGAARALAGLPRPAIGWHIGAREDRRRLDPAACAEATTIVHKGHRGCAVLLGGAEEVPAAAALARHLAGAGIPYRDLTGRLPLAETAAVTAALDLLLTTDSGPAHLAYATGTRSVTVFLDSDPERWGPPSAGPHRVLDCRRAGTAELAAAIAAAGRV